MRWALDARRAGPLHRPAAPTHSLAPRADRPRRPRADEPTPGAPTDAPDATGPVRADPLGRSRRAAGYDDPERWWEDVVEHRADGLDRLRRPSPRRWPRSCADRRARGRRSDRDARREAHMRRGAARGRPRRRASSGSPSSAAPGTRRRSTGRLPPRPPTTGLLHGLPEGRRSPRPGCRGRTARLASAIGLRRRRRLARLVPPPVHRRRDAAGRALAGRGPPACCATRTSTSRRARRSRRSGWPRRWRRCAARPLAGLREVTEATRAVLCDGTRPAARAGPRRGWSSASELGARARRRADGAARGATCAASSARLRLDAEARAETLDLDLRKPERPRPAATCCTGSRLLGIAWGDRDATAGAGTGTFQETLAAGVAARASRSRSSRPASGAPPSREPRPRRGRPSAAEQADRPRRPRPPLVERCLLADLPDAVARPCSPRSSDRAAARHDVAAPDGARRRRWPARLRYGDVRGTDAGAAAPACVAGLVARICVGLPARVRGARRRRGRRTIAGRIDARRTRRWRCSPTPSLTRAAGCGRSRRLADRDGLHGWSPAGVDPAAARRRPARPRPRRRRRMGRRSRVGAPPARGGRVGRGVPRRRRRCCWSTTTTLLRARRRAGSPALADGRVHRGCCRCCGARSATLRSRPSGGTIGEQRPRARRRRPRRRGRPRRRRGARPRAAPAAVLPVAGCSAWRVTASDERRDRRGERLRRWRLVLGGGADGTRRLSSATAGHGRRAGRAVRQRARAALERALRRRARRGLGGSAPQRRALARRHPHLLPVHASSRSCSATRSSGSTCASCCSSRSCCEAVEPDVHLVGTLLVARTA